VAMALLNAELASLGWRVFTAQSQRQG
jgi:hypothetical protein